MSFIDRMALAVGIAVATVGVGGTVLAFLLE